MSVQHLTIYRRGGDLERSTMSYGGALADTAAVLFGLIEQASAADFRQGTVARREVCQLYQALGAMMDAADADDDLVTDEDRQRPAAPLGFVIEPDGSLWHR